ncbi:MAG: DUF3990 domain-containing protein, partial [Kangiellaceae bacterium]|nr:DUF3990 domain-containing protein [Kangiellaceae bacterium]
MSSCHGSTEDALQSINSSQNPFDSVLADLVVGWDPITGATTSAYEMVMGESMVNGDDRSRFWGAVGVLSLGWGNKLGKVDEFIDLYHGTNSAGAKSIIENGIDLAKGSGKVDFGRGFYTTTDYEQAVIRASKKSADNVGEVLHFRVKVSELKSLNNLYLNSGASWARFTRHNRLRGKMHEYDTVSGDMVGNVRNLLNGKDPRPFGQQTSFHSDKALEL